MRLEATFASKKDVNTMQNDILQPASASASASGVLPLRRPGDSDAIYCQCTGPGCLTLFCPCFSSALLCSMSCSCQVCGNAPAIKQGTHMTLEQIDSQLSLPFVPKEVTDTFCTCEKDCSTEPCTACLMHDQFYACLNPFAKKCIGIECLIESANSSLTADRMKIISEQQIGSANPLAIDQRVKGMPELSQLPGQQHIRYTSPSTSNPSMMRNPAFPQCSSQQIEHANPLTINQTVQTAPSELGLSADQQKMNSTIPSCLGQQIEPYNAHRFNQTVINVPGSHLPSGHQKITSSLPATFNPVTALDDDSRCCKYIKSAQTNHYSDCFNAKSYYEYMCWQRQVSYREGKQEAIEMATEKITSKKSFSQKAKKLSVKAPVSKVRLNGCLCQRFNCGKRNCKCLKYGVSCTDLCQCTGCQNPHGRRNSAVNND